MEVSLKSGLKIVLVVTLAMVGRISRMPEWNRQVDVALERILLSLNQKQLSCPAIRVD
jgi:hypothetical protein